MNLPSPPDQYNRDDQSRVRDILGRADTENHKRGRDINVAPGRLILTSPNGTRYAITVSNSGVLSTAVVG